MTLVDILQRWLWWRCHLTPNSVTHQQLTLKSFWIASTSIIAVFTLTRKHYNYLLTLRWNKSFCCFVIRLLKYLLGVFSMKYLLSVLYCAWSVFLTQYNRVTIILLLISLPWLALTLNIAQIPYQQLIASVKLALLTC